MKKKNTEEIKKEIDKSFDKVSILGIIRGVFKMFID